MHKTLEHSDKDCAPSEDAPPLTFGVHFRLGGVCGYLSSTGSFVSHRPLPRAERTQNEDYLQIYHWGSRGGRGF